MFRWQSGFYIENGLRLYFRCVLKQQVGWNISLIHWWLLQLMINVRQCLTSSTTDRLVAAKRYVEHRKEIKRSKCFYPEADIVCCRIVCMQTRTQVHEHIVYCVMGIALRAPLSSNIVCQCCQVNFVCIFSVTILSTGCLVCVC